MFNTKKLRIQFFTYICSTVLDLVGRLSDIQLIFSDQHLEESGCYLMFRKSALLRLVKTYDSQNGLRECHVELKKDSWHKWKRPSKYGPNAAIMRSEIYERMERIRAACRACLRMARHPRGPTSGSQREVEASALRPCADRCAGILLQVGQEAHAAHEA